MLFFWDFNQTWSFRQIFEISSSIKFHENMSWGTRIVPCGSRQTNLTNLTVAFRNFAKVAKNTTRIVCKYNNALINLTFIGPCIVIYFYRKTNQMHQCLNFIFFRNKSTCFGRSFRPSSRIQDGAYRNRHMSNGYCYWLLAGTLASISNICLTYACFCM